MNPLLQSALKREAMPQSPQEMSHEEKRRYRYAIARKQEACRQELLNRYKANPKEFDYQRDGNLPAFG